MLERKHSEATGKVDLLEWNKSFLKGEHMKLSKYNYFCKAENDKFIIFNTFSSAILRVDSDFFNMLTSNFLLFDKKIIDNLYELGIVVNDDYDEMALSSHDRATNIYSRESVTYRILTTTACNARCFYCYENNFESSTMSIMKVVCLIETGTWLISAVIAFVIMISKAMVEQHLQSNTLLLTE